MPTPANPLAARNAISGFNLDALRDEVNETQYLTKPVS